VLLNIQSCNYLIYDAPATVQKKLSRLHKTFYLFRRPPYPHAAVNNMQSKTADFASGAAIWRTGRNIRVVSDSGPFGQLRENMTSSTKPKMNDLLHCLLRRIETRHAQVTCTENLVNIGRVLFEICERTETQTDRQTDTLVGMLHPATRGEVTGRGKSTLSFSCSSAVDRPSECIFFQLTLSRSVFQNTGRP